jgi:thioredoxin reductase
MQASTEHYDAVIIGGGPAGVSCAVWLARLGYAPVLLEAGSRIGGLCRMHPFPDDWNASLPGMTGPQVADNLELSLEQAGVPVLLSHAVAHIEPAGREFIVTARHEGGEATLRAAHVVLATGVTARGLPQADTAAAGAGAAQAGGKGMTASSSVLIGPGAHIVAQDFTGKQVAVLGGGDNAFENALYAMRHGASLVQVYARNVRAQQQFVRQIPAAQMHVGEYQVDVQACAVNGRRYDLILVFYGWEPNARFAGSLDLSRGEQGFIATDAATAQTSFPGVYAIGEVTQRQHPCVVTALADGVTAAKAIQARIERGRG